MISKRQKPTLYLPIGLEIISGCKVELLIFSTQRTLYSFIGIQLSHACHYIPHTPIYAYDVWSKNLHIVVVVQGNHSTTTQGPLSVIDDKDKL